jgi:hypothetical protein
LGFQVWLKSISKIRKLTRVIAQTAVSAVFVAAISPIVVLSSNPKKNQNCSAFTVEFVAELSKSSKQSLESKPAASSKELLSYPFICSN